jgi:hypothetical protein
VKIHFTGSIQRVLGDDGISSVQLLRQRHAVVRGAVRFGMLSLIALSVAACVPGWLEGDAGPGLGPLCGLTLSFVANALFHLLKRWSLQFRVATDYRPVGLPQDSDAVLVSTRPPRYLHDNGSLSCS